MALAVEIVPAARTAPTARIVANPRRSDIAVLPFRRPTARLCWRCRPSRSATVVVKATATNGLRSKVNRDFGIFPLIRFSAANPPYFTQPCDATCHAHSAGFARTPIEHLPRWTVYRTLTRRQHGPRAASHR